jgi:hypothetical protein
MAVPFYDRVSPRCTRCQRRKHVDKFRKWYAGRFVLRPYCLGCEPGERMEESRATNPMSAPQPPTTPHLKRKAWRFTMNGLNEAHAWCMQTAQRSTPAWREFLDAYSNAVASAVERAENMQRWGKDAPAVDYFFSPSMLRRLKELYEVADPQGAMPYGKPACLKWWAWGGFDAV